MIGIIKWFDGQEGELIDINTGLTYYMYKDSLPLFSNNLKGQIVEFSLYTNLCMSQVDKIMLLSKLSQIPKQLHGQNWSMTINNLIEHVKTLNLIKNEYLDKHKIIVE